MIEGNQQAVERRRCFAAQHSRGGLHILRLRLAASADIAPAGADELRQSQQAARFRRLGPGGESGEQLLGLAAVPPFSALRASCKRCAGSEGGAC